MCAPCEHVEMWLPGVHPIRRVRASPDPTERVSNGLWSRVRPASLGLALHGPWGAQEHADYRRGNRVAAEQPRQVTGHQTVFTRPGRHPDNEAVGGSSPPRPTHEGTGHSLLGRYESAQCCASADRRRFPPGLAGRAGRAARRCIVSVEREFAGTYGSWCHPGADRPPHGDMWRHGRADIGIALKINIIPDECAPSPVSCSPPARARSVSSRSSCSSAAGSTYRPGPGPSSRQSLVSQELQR
jgi:hypothetical protein